MRVSCGYTSEKRGGNSARLAELRETGALHRQKMSRTETCVQHWVRKSPRAQQGLLRYWQQDLTRNQELADVMRGILQERGIQ